MPLDRDKLMGSTLSVKDLMSGGFQPSLELEKVSTLSRLCHSSDGRIRPSRVVRTDHTQPVADGSKSSAMFVL